MSVCTVGSGAVESGAVESGTVGSDVLTSATDASVRLELTIAAGADSPSRSASAGAGATPPSINSPHAAVAPATTTVVMPPTLITMKS